MVREASRGRALAAQMKLSCSLVAACVLRFLRPLIKRALLVAVCLLVPFAALAQTAVLVNDGDMAGLIAAINSANQAGGARPRMCWRATPLNTSAGQISRYPTMGSDGRPNIRGSLSATPSVPSMAVTASSRSPAS